MCVGVHLKCPLLVSSFKQAFSYRDRYSYKSPHYKVTQKKSIQWKSNCFMRTDKHNQASRHFTMQACEKTNHNVMHECYLEVFWILYMHNATFYSCLHKAWFLIQ
jgi:hypothetical protein